MTHLPDKHTKKANACARCDTEPIDPLPPCIGYRARGEKNQANMAAAEIYLCVPFPQLDCRGSPSTRPRQSSRMPN